MQLPADLLAVMAPADLAVLGFAVAIFVLLILLAVVARQGGAARQDADRLRLLAEQALAGQRAEAELTRAALTAGLHRSALDASELRGQLNTGIETVRTTLSREQGELRLRLTELLEARLGEIRTSVNEQLHAAVEKQMTDSFARVIDQFTAVQKAMGDVQAVTAQIGDIKRLFTNVKTRGGWGETQLRAMLDDALPPGSWQANCKLRPDGDEMVDFAVTMPMRGGDAPVLPIDAKFPVEDYDRLLIAAEAGDAEGERAARRALERRVRDEARKIAAKYLHPPETVEFAVLYLPTDGLYAEIARAPGLLDEIGRESRVMVMGPSLLPALLRTIHLGHVTLTLEGRAAEVRTLLAATKQEMVAMDDVLMRLSRQASTFSTTIDRARVRTRAVRRKLRGVEEMGPAEAERLLEVDGVQADEFEESPSP